MKIWQVLLVSIALTGCATAPVSARAVNRAGINITLAPFDPTDMPVTVCETEEHCVVEAGLLDEVNDQTVLAVMKRLRAAEEAHARHFVLEIDTPGGSVPAGQLLARAIERSPIPITCVDTNQASSMGSYIMQACPTRIMLKSSTQMFHEIALGAQFHGHPHEWQAIADMLAAMQRALSNHCVRRMNISVDELLAKTNGGLMWWLGWEEAMKVGAVDKAVWTYKEALAGL